MPGRRAISTELYDWLHHAIVSGGLRPHERLVETTIASLASVSRTPVREALQRLDVDGLVRPGEDGTLAVNDLSLDELGDICAVRETLEGMATGLAAVSRSEIELAMLGRILEQERELLGAGDEAVATRVELNHSFHETLWGASRNRYLAEDLRRLRSRIERIQDTTLRDPERIEEALEEHAAIVDALNDRDADTADRLAREHFQHAMAMRMRRLGERSRPAPRRTNGAR